MTTDLYPAYHFPCRRCKQPVWVNVTTIQYGGDRTKYAQGVAEHWGVEAAQQIYEIDLATYEWRLGRINATPPGMTLQVVPDRVNCDWCKLEYIVPPLLRGNRLSDAGAFNCEKCGREGFCPFSLLEERPTDQLQTNLLEQFVQMFRIGHADPESLVILATTRLVISGDVIVAIDRLSEAPEIITCQYCGSDMETRLLEPKPLQ